jgi:5-methyltetrahydrofolate--homocysteine methyltransferase
LTIPADRIREALTQGLDADVRQLCQDALEAGSSAKEILDTALIPAIEVVGDRFRSREIFLPDVLLAARAMHAGLAVIRPRLEAGASVSRGTVILGTVEGDLHDIGKNLVGIMLRGMGYEVVDLGINVSPAAFVEAVRGRQARVVGLSALLTTTMPAMRRVIAALREAGLHDVKTMVGGAAVSQAFAHEIGADAYGCDAARACEIVKSWLP